jgi:ketosteroid isomerase-like protein
MTSRPLAALVIFLAGCATGAAMRSPVNIETLKQQVADSERAFAKTMADRDLNAFRTFLSPETIFFSGQPPKRGPDQVVEYWQRFYRDQEAPFSWQPSEVEVIDSGRLALTSGPVRDPKGNVFATFTSIWRLEDDGRWRVLFDKGNPVCPPKS